ncbi:hypothetical protein X771_32355 [Mesorhizobium sp. LSJC277A00]|nr:hypothetical protein X771_32355 [Mesorhizobium sp. LSJC277A00]ESX13309.1 hypothetical protein X767_30320 [Mesorhizobium sp. LSJC264A00]
MDEARRYQAKFWALRRTSRVLDAQADLSRCMFLHAFGNADPARLGDPLQTRGDVDPRAQDVTVLFDDVADGNTGIEVVTLMAVQALEGTFFVSAHQLTVPGEVSRKDRRELALDPTDFHPVPLQGVRIIFAQVKRSKSALPVFFGIASTMSGAPVRTEQLGLRTRDRATHW